MTDNDVITLQDEEGNEHSFAVIDIFPVNAVNYAILVPVDENGDSKDEGGDEIEAVIFRIVDEGDDRQTLYLVEDEKEWDNIAEIWEERSSEEEPEE